jgi:hypothetical protein
MAATYCHYEVLEECQRECSKAKPSSKPQEHYTERQNVRMRDPFHYDLSCSGEKWTDHWHHTQM